jgi:hypothetical protein
MRSLPAILCLTFVLLFACKKSTEPPKGIPAGMRATIDGQSWAADTAGAFIVRIIDGENPVQTLGAIGGAKQRVQEGSQIELDFPELKVGTYTTSMGTLIAVYAHGYIEQEQQHIDYYIAIPPLGTGVPAIGSATLTISKYNGEKAEGKFSFVAFDSLGIDSVKVTSGTFNLNVIETTIDISQKQDILNKKRMLLPGISRKYFDNFHEWK